jgi:hypothetical protein
LRVSLDDVHERLLALAVTDDVDEGILPEELLGMVGYVRPAEHDQVCSLRARSSRAMARWRLAFQTYVLKPTMSALGERLGPAAHIRAMHHRQSEGVPLGPVARVVPCRPASSATEYGRYIDSPSAVLSWTSDTRTLLSRITPPRMAQPVQWKTG